jgi:hypothetical protein
VTNERRGKARSATLVERAGIRSVLQMFIGEVIVGEAKVGEAFITHELDEAIAIQQSIVTAEESLSRDHPRASAKRLIRQALRQDERFLGQLRELGRSHGATGKAEEVAEALQELMTETSEKTTEADSGAYEAHAVLVNLKRKQQDSGAAMIKIARATKDTTMRDAAKAFAKATKTSAQELADELAEFAVSIATVNRATRASSTRSRTSV